MLRKSCIHQRKCNSSWHFVESDDLKPSQRLWKLQEHSLTAGHLGRHGTCQVSFHTTSKTSKLMCGRPSRRPNASAPFGSSASAWSCMLRYLITYWQWGRSFAKYIKLPTHVLKVVASPGERSSDLSSRSMSACAGLFLFWFLAFSPSKEHSCSTCLWCVWMVSLPSAWSTWCLFRKVISSPGHSMHCIEMS